MKTAANAGTTATYTYNALGQRIRRATSSLTTLYVYDEAGHLAGEYTAAGALIQETVWLGDRPIATVRPDGAGGVNLFYVHTDHLNTPRLVTDTANNIRWRWDSDPFGTTPPNEDPSTLGTFEYNLRFPGQQYDAVVGLHYNYFRDYDPAVGRYVEFDPIGLTGGLNTYTYAMNRPSISADPLGLFSMTFAVQWSEVDSLESGILGSTEAILKKVVCTCACTSGAWTVEGCYAYLYLDVNILGRYDSRRQREFARNGEQEHILDFRNALPRIRRRGEEEEQSWRSYKFSSKTQCENVVAGAVRAALMGELIEVFHQTRERDLSGSHTYKE